MDKDVVIDFSFTERDIQKVEDTWIEHAKNMPKYPSFQLMTDTMTNCIKKAVENYLGHNIFLLPKGAIGEIRNPSYPDRFILTVKGQQLGMIIQKLCHSTATYTVDFLPNKFDFEIDH